MANMTENISNGIFATTKLHFQGQRGLPKTQILEVGQDFHHQDPFR